MLATNNNETGTNTITNNNETLNKDNQNNTNEELTFKIEKVVIKTEDENNSWSKAYSIGTSTIAYNSYTKKYQGHISNDGKWNEQGIYVENGGRDIEVSKEEFRNTLYYEFMQNIKNDKDSIQSDKNNYLSQLNELYHLSD